MRPLVISLAAAIASMLVGCGQGSKGSWTTFADASASDSLDWAVREQCDFSDPRRHPPPSSPALTETEALEYVGRLYDGVRCVSPDEQRRIARDTAALRLYAEQLSGACESDGVDCAVALLWLARSDDPRPWATHFLAHAVVDSSNAQRRAWFVPAALGLLRLAPDDAAARERLETLARKGSGTQRWGLARLLVEVNDSAARSLLREHAPDLAAGTPPGSRMLRDIASVLAAPPPGRANMGPCVHGSRLGRSAEGAFTCVLPGPGMRVVRSPQYRRVASFERPRKRGQRKHDYIAVTVSGPGFLSRDAQVIVDVKTEASNANLIFSIDPDSLLRTLHHEHGRPISASQIRDSVVFPVRAELSGETLVLRREAGASRGFDVVFASPMVVNGPVQVRTIGFTHADANRLVNALRDAARVAKQFQAAGVEDPVSK